RAKKSVAMPRTTHVFASAEPISVPLSALATPSGVKSAAIPRTNVADSAIPRPREASVAPKIETVIGTIGKTHGVRLATNPKPNETAAAMARPFSAYLVKVDVSDPSAHARLGKRNSAASTTRDRIGRRRLFTVNAPSGEVNTEKIASCTPAYEPGWVIQKPLQAGGIVQAQRTESGRAAFRTLSQMDPAPFNSVAPAGPAV